jgi:DNA mismatch repair ATPase MutS
MAEFMRRILKLFQDLDKEVTSINDNLKELLRIAKNVSNIEETFSILAQTTSIFGKLDKFNLLKAMIFDTFDKIEFDRLDQQSQEDIESSNSANSKEKMSVEEGKDRYETLSLRPNYQ